MLNDGGVKRQPVLDIDVCLGVHNALQMEESKGQIYELGGPQVYEIKELMEYLSNVLNHRPKYIKFSYDDFMKLYHSPNSNFEVSSYDLKF
jgi:nucleoside-diphosphate-sugar epimerase